MSNEEISAILTFAKSKFTVRFAETDGTYIYMANAYTDIASKMANPDKKDLYSLSDIAKMMGRNN